jgi:hypothetical protein
MPASGRPGYAEVLARALGLPAEALMEEWRRQAVEARTQAVREHLRRWVSEWVGRLDQGSLREHLDEASTRLRVSRSELDAPMDTGLPRESRPASSSSA